MSSLRQVLHRFDELAAAVAIASQWTARELPVIEAALADVIKAPEVTAVRWTADDMSPVD